MKRFGIVEGFYGKLLSFDERKIFCDALKSSELNFYLYAPKEDPFIRTHIDLEHTKEWLNDFEDFASFTEELGINLGIGLSLINTNDFENLKTKIRQFKGFKIKYFSILFDDIDSNFDYQNQKRVMTDLMDSFPEINLDYCPTVYSSELINKNIEHANYFSQFTKDRIKDLNFFWTGEKVISTSLNKDSETDLDEENSSLISIWDNYFTTDSCPKKMNLTLMKHLDHSYLMSKDCYLVNLTGMPRTDSLIIDLFGNFKAKSDSSFEDILLKHGVDERLIPYVYLFDPSQKIKIDSDTKDKIHKIMFTWFHPLKNEWYPYLHNLKNWE